MLIGPHAPLVVERGVFLRNHFTASALNINTIVM